MKLLYIALLIAPSLFSQPTISRVAADFIDYAGARINVQTSTVPASANFFVQWGYAHNSTPFTTPANAGEGIVHFMVPIINARPGVRVYVKPRISSSGTFNNTWACSGGAITQGTLVGLTCDPGEVLPYFTTSVVPGPWNVPFPSGTFPAQPTVPAYTMPTVASPVEGSNMFTVASNCSDLTTKMASAVTAAASQNVLLMLPFPGTTSPCGQILTPTKSSAFRVIVRSAAGDLYLPPPNGRIEEKHRPYMARVQSAIGDLAVSVESTDNGYIFFGVEFTFPSEYPTTDVAAIAINSLQDYDTSGDSQWRINLASPLPANVVAGSRISLEGVPTLNSVCKTGPMSIQFLLDQSTPIIYCQEAVVPDATDSTSGRFLIPVGAQRFASVTPGACAGGNARVSLAASSRWGLAVDNVIHIRDTVGLANINNRNFRIASTSGSAACLAASTGVSGTHSANTGMYAVDGPVHSIVSVAVGATQIWFDRCWIAGQPFPSRTLYAMAMYGTQTGVVNSRITNVGGWEAIDPVGGNYVYYGTHPFSATGIAVAFTNAQQLLIENNYVGDATGILFFAEQVYGGTTITSDVMIRRNESHMPLTRMGGSSTSDGLYWITRHHAELKGGQRICYEGNYFDGTWSDDIATGATMAFTTRLTGGTPSGLNPLTDVTYIRDITIRDNTFVGVSGGVNITQMDFVEMGAGGRHVFTAPAIRYAIVNNRFFIDWFALRSVPSFTFGATKAVSGTGGTFLHANAAHSLTVSHNLIYDPKGQAPYFLDYGEGTPVIHQTITDNIYFHNMGEAGTGGIVFSATGITWAGSVAATWANITARGGAGGTLEADPYSRWQGNLIVPGNSNNFNYNDTDATCAVSTSTDCNFDEAEKDAYYGTSTVGTYVPHPYNFTGTSPNARRNEVGFQGQGLGLYQMSSTGNYPASARYGASTDSRDIGPDEIAITSSRRAMTNLRVLSLRTTTATVALNAPAPSVPCYVSCPTCPGTTRYSDSSASIPRSIAMTGLSSGTSYTITATCGSDEQSISFRTQ